MNELAKIDSFSREVAIAETIEEMQQLNLKGEIMAEMGRILNIPLEGQNKLGRTRIELTKKLREIIKVKFSKGGKGANQYKKVLKSENVTLADVSITRNTSSDAKIIKEEEEEAEEVMNELEAKREVITPKIVAQKLREKKKKKQRAEKSEAGKNIKIDIDFRLGDFEQVLSDIPDGSIDCIITDPPYPLEFIECWTKLSRFAQKKLKPNGFCIAYSGQMHLPEVMKRMNEFLDYYWTFALIHSGSKQLINGRKLFCGWKPILVFQNKFKLHDKDLFEDIIIGTGKEKENHRWQQAKGELIYLINNFTNPGDFVCDPFSGSGTTLIALKELNRIPLGAEINETEYNIAKNRINELL